MSGRIGRSAASFQEIVREELNVKEFRYVEDASQFVSYTFKPQLKILGQKYGKKIGDIRTALAALDGSQAKKELDEAGAIRHSGGRRNHPADGGGAADRNRPEPTAMSQPRTGAPRWCWIPP